jgi:hypothetical protein
LFIRTGLRHATIDFLTFYPGDGNAACSVIVERDLDWLKQRSISADESPHRSGQPSLPLFIRGSRRLRPSGSRAQGTSGNHGQALQQISALHFAILACSARSPVFVSANGKVAK